MSAYIVSPIDVAAIALASTDGDQVRAERRARVLAKENVRSVARHYGMTPATACRAFLGLGYREYLGMCAQYCGAPVMEEYMLTHRPGTGKLHDLVRVYQYQTDGHPCWPGSLAETISTEALQSSGTPLPVGRIA